MYDYICGEVVWSNKRLFDTIVDLIEQILEQFERDDMLSLPPIWYVDFLGRSTLSNRLLFLVILDYLREHVLKVWLVIDARTVRVTLQELLHVNYAYDTILVRIKVLELLDNVVLRKQLSLAAAS